MTVAAESLVAQLHSQSKHTMPRRENGKIRYENATLKEKGSTQIYLFTPKNITPKSRETIPLTLILTASYP
jgi:hypothetical protein